jgi:hypothetical protein
LHEGGKYYQVFQEIQRIKHNESTTHLAQFVPEQSQEKSSGQS